MSTNYYLKRNVCPCCGNHRQKLHIGEFSYGWYFALTVYEEDSLPKNLADWDTLLKEENSEICDEYGDTLSYERMLDKITVNSHPVPVAERIKNTSYSLDNFLTFNAAEIGCHNLLRRKINDFCIGHGPDDLPYDLIIKELG